MDVDNDEPSPQPAKETKSKPQSESDSDSEDETEQERQKRLTFQRILQSKPALMHYIIKCAVRAIGRSSLVYSTLHVHLCIQGFP